jgi:hypothetical protein
MLNAPQLAIPHFLLAAVPSCCAEPFSEFGHLDPAI